jgi:hypothetical protein
LCDGAIVPGKTVARRRGQQPGIAEDRRDQYQKEKNIWTMSASSE